MFCLSVSDAVARLLHTTPAGDKFSLHGAEGMCEMWQFKRRHTGGEKKKKRKQPFNITHVPLFLRSLRFRGNDRCHRPWYHHPSGLSADHPEDIQQVGPHSCCWQDNSWTVNYTSRETDNRAIFILLKEDQTPAFRCLSVKACEYKQSCIQTYSYKRLKWRPIHSKTSQVACASYSWTYCMWPVPCPASPCYLNHFKRNNFPSITHYLQYCPQRLNHKVEY